MDGAGMFDAIRWAADASQRYPWWVVLGVTSGVAAWLWWQRSERRERQRDTLRRVWLDAALRAAKDEDTDAFLQIAAAIGLASRPNGETRSPDRGKGSRTSSHRGHANERASQVEHRQAGGNISDSVSVGHPVDGDRRSPQSGKRARKTA